MAPKKCAKKVPKKVKGAPQTKVFFKNTQTPTKDPIDPPEAPTAEPIEEKAEEEQEETDDQCDKARECFKIIKVSLHTTSAHPTMRVFQCPVAKWVVLCYQSEEFVTWATATKLLWCSKCLDLTALDNGTCTPSGVHFVPLCHAFFCHDARAFPHCHDVWCQS